MTIHSLGSEAIQVAKVSLLGVDGDLSWAQDEKGLTIQVPSEKPCEHAYTFKVVKGS